MKKKDDLIKFVGIMPGADAPAIDDNVGLKVAQSVVQTDSAAYQSTNVFIRCRSEKDEVGRSYLGGVGAENRPRTHVVTIGSLLLEESDGFALCGVGAKHRILVFRPEPSAAHVGGGEVSGSTRPGPGRLSF